MEDTKTFEIIRNMLKKIESDYQIFIVLAVDIGSRAWGWDGRVNDGSALFMFDLEKESDYDIRFIFVHRLGRISL